MNTTSPGGLDDYLIERAVGRIRARTEIVERQVSDPERSNAHLIVALSDSADRAPLYAFLSHPHITIADVDSFTDASGAPVLTARFDVEGSGSDTDYFLSDDFLPALARLISAYHGLGATNLSADIAIPEHGAGVWAIQVEPHRPTITLDFLTTSRV